MYPPSKLLILNLLFHLIVNYSYALPGEDCANAGDVSDQVTPNDPFGYGITLDTRTNDQFLSFTAPSAGTLQFDQGYNGVTYLVIYDDQCTIIDEKLLWHSYDVYNIELEDGETIVLECDRRNNVAGKEIFDATIHFQEQVEGEHPEDAISLVEGSNQVTRYLGKQYFKYETTQTGLLTIKTCQDRSQVDGTQLKLYQNGLLDNLLQGNVWCSNDPDGDLTQSIIEYQVTNLSKSLVLETTPVTYWYEGYELEVSFIPDVICDIELDLAEPTIFHVDNSEGDQWFTFTATKTGPLEITTGYTSYREGNTLMSLGQDTYIRVYDNCNGSLIARSDDISGWFGGSHVVFEAMVGFEYVIHYDDRFTSGSYQSEVFYTEDATRHALEADAQAVTEGTYRAQVNYADNHWFSYTFSQTGTLKARNNGTLGLELPYKEETEIETYYDDLEKIEFDYGGVAGETVLIRVYDAGDFKEGNADIELTLEVAGATCSNAIDVETGNTYALDHTPDGAPYQEDFWYSFKTDEAGELTITNCEQTEAITKVTAFDVCGGTLLGVADGNCDGGAELIISLDAGDEVVVKWDDHNAPDWNIQDFDYDFEVQFVPEVMEDGLSCETAFSIAGHGVYEVDNVNGDQWFRFTAPETTEIAITTGSNADGWGDVKLANGQDTKFKVYDACGGTLMVQNDDSGLLSFGQSYAALEVIAGSEYLIQWEDQFVNAHQYQFEIFPVNDFFAHATEADPESIDVGVHRAYLNYKSQHWFKYTFPSNGVLVAVNLNEQEERVIPSYQMLYGDNGLNLELPNQSEFVIRNWSDDEPTETNFMYAGVAGEEVLLRVKEVAGIYFYSIGNRDFELAFFDGADYDDLCHFEAELTEGIQEINATDGDQKYKFTASEAGNYIFSVDDNPSTLISLYDQCFSDPIYTKYNDFYYEKEMEAGEEVYLVFLDEYGGAGNFKIRREEPCGDVVTAHVESCHAYEFNEELLTVSGLYGATFTNQAGCDSLVNLSLTILESSASETVVAACESYDWNDVTYSTTGIYEVLLENTAGCDSTAVLDLTILESSFSETVVAACESYDWNDVTYMTTGIYEVLLENTAGCDSTAVLDLTILESSFSETVVAACEIYDWNDVTYTTTGIYEVLLENTVGCDSTAVLDLTILESRASETVVAACESYDWNEVTYTTTGIYEVLLENVAGCDSTAVLDLAILESSSSKTVVATCESYDWNEVTYTTTGIYEVLLENAAGCDSTAVLDLTILESTSSETIVEACESYEWNGVIYTSTGIYETLLENVAGCDSTAIVDLTIFETPSSETVVEACENYEWNGATYTSTGVYEVRLKNEAGHDSTAVLDLTILEATSSEMVIESCDSYDWNGLTYTSSGIYQVLLENNAGCDSTSVLNLTIRESTSSLTYAEVYDAYEWNGETYFESGLYEYQGINAFGCDSLAQLDLTILEPKSQSITFEEIADLTYGTSDIQLDAIASSGLEVAYSSSNPEVASLVGGSLKILAAGEASITASQAGNEQYRSAEEVTMELVVNKATLTVRLDDGKKVYGTENPEFIFTYEGFLHDDDESVLESIPVASTMATTTSDVGSYVISASGGVSDKYAFEYEEATLLIEQSDQQIQFETLNNRTYGDVEFSLLAEANSGLSVTFQSSDEQVAVINDGKVEIVGAGASTITAIQQGDQNFKYTALSRELTVEKAPLVIKASDQFIHLRQQLPTLTMEFEGLVNEESVEHIEVLPTISTDATAASEVGEYNITLNGGEDRNYAIELINGVLTIDVALSTPVVLEDVQVYPNPPVDQLNIDLPEQYSNVRSRITLRDASGRIYHQSFEKGKSILLDTSTLPRGLLILQIQVNSQIYTRPIMKR
ncbi:MAG: MBG domain-containing protein [Cytophagales bacterium]|nr:MBG domain-containing protein [Cytophagales bacterium]